MEAGQLQAAKPCLQELARRLNLSYEEALVVACLFNLSNYGNIDMDDLCRYFNCRPLQVLSMRTALDSLCDKGFLCVSRRTRGNDFRCYSIPEKIVSAIRYNRLPEPKNYAGLTADEWIDELEEIFTEARDSELSSSRIADTVHQLIDSNPQLRLVQYIKQFDLSDNDLLLVLMTTPSLILAPAQLEKSSACLRLLFSNGPSSGSKFAGKKLHVVKCRIKIRKKCK